MTTKKLCELSEEERNEYCKVLRRQPPIKVTDLSSEELAAIMDNTRKTIKTVNPGEPCSRGHPWADRMVVIDKGKKALRCRSCIQESSRKSFEKTPTEILKERNFRPAARLRRFDLHLRRTHGIDYKEWLRMWYAQNGKCATCCRLFPLDDMGNPKFGPDVHVDHDHHTNQIRELLCFPCNRMIGTLEHEIAPKLLEYLLKHGSTLGKAVDLM